MTRTKLDARIVIALTPQLREAVERAAERDLVTASTFVRQALHEKLRRAAQPQTGREA